MRIKFFHYILGIGIILSFLSCGSSSTAQKSNTDILTEENFVSLAKFHFSKESRELLKNKTIEEQNNKKFRSYPGAQQSDLSNDTTLKITTVTPFDSYIESMTLSTQKHTIKVEVKNKLYVIVSLYENDSLVKTIEQTMNEFQSFNLPTEGDAS